MFLVETGESRTLRRTERRKRSSQISRRCKRATLVVRTLLGGILGSLRWYRRAMLWVELTVIQFNL